MIQQNSKMKSEKYQQDKVMIDYTTGCSLDYGCFKDNYRLTAADLSKQKALDAEPRASQQIVFQGKSGQKLRLYTILEKSKETEFNK